MAQFNLKEFQLPKNFRGRSNFVVQLWWFIQATMFALSPQFLYSWRAFLLRVFGAEIGEGVKVRPSVKVTYPWRLAIGDYSWVGDDVTLYTLANITIGSNSVVSQKSYLCAGSHDYTKPTFDMKVSAVEIGDGCWIATDVFIFPGVSVANNTIVGARSTVKHSINRSGIYSGNPLKCIQDSKSSYGNTQ